jgi:hypothetical protein
VASDAYAVLHNKKTDLQFKGHENYVDEKCISTPCWMQEGAKATTSKSIMCTAKFRIVQWLYNLKKYFYIL